MCVCVCVYVCSFVGGPVSLYTCIKLIAFELAGEDREQRENPVVSRLKIAFYALHKRG